MPIRDCPYSVVVASEPNATHGLDPVVPTATTGSNGEWAVPQGLEGTDYRLVVAPESYLRVEFRLRAESLKHEVVVLRMPSMAACRVSLKGAHLDDGARWDCLVEPWDSRIPDRNDTVPELRTKTYGAYGEVLMVVSAFKFVDLSASDDFSYLAPVGSQLVLGPWSEGSRLTGYSPRVVVPSVTVITAAPSPGLRVTYQNEEGRRIQEDGLIFAHGRERARLLRYPMYEGAAFLEGAKFQGEPKVVVEFCAKDGEFFRAEVEPALAVPVQRIEFVRGRGQHALEVLAPAGVECLGGWYRSGEGKWTPMSASGSLAVSARQFHRLDGRVLVALPADHEGALFWTDGSVVKLQQGGLRWVSVGPGAQSFHVVPPYLLQELASNECIVATLQAAFEGRTEEWVDVESRRLVAGVDASPWVVRQPDSVRYRTEWRRLIEHSGQWRRVDQGIHVVAGPNGFPAHR